MTMNNAQNLGPTHGMMMLYSSAAAILGPSLLLQLRSMSEMKFINELLQVVRGTYRTTAAGAIIISYVYLLFDFNFSASCLLLA